ncbi:aminobutyraldehyde dehydrogenase [Actinocrinis sp.]|uniref:aminobutyraldehyde dehydrogenase n=1 Tax=Actinocrinis sp. TaxID=1920516 RepID=UPI002CF4F543|nr:aminobutyraldehyde dehydrogenase [Actinocrinis sp.]HXR72530.1 aminobutyraldehyde dehydrogenase [Actinocrinis sp.]
MRRLENFIGAAAAAPEGSQYSTILDPATEEPIALAPRSRETEVDRAVRAAKDAAPIWRQSTPADRAQALLRIADDVERAAQEFADLEVANTGKPRELTLNEEIAPAVDQLRFFAGAARTMAGRPEGEYLAGYTSSVSREPVGVCAQITPWNYPLQMAVWKLGPAIATGNTVVLKPAETTPLTTLRLAAVAARHLPPGTLNVICGDRDTGALLAAHPEVEMVSLTGSVRAGREVAAAAGPALKRLHLELGGNAPAIVFPDARLDAAAEGITQAGFFNAGQDCVAASRVLIHEDILDDLLGRLVERAKATRTGPPSDPAADYGPLNNAAQLARMAGLIARAPAYAKVLTGGERVKRSGYFFAPTVITGLRQDDELVQEEIFGPVLTVQSFASADEALALANGVPQGLAASVWTTHRPTAKRFARDLAAGCVWINTHLRFAAEMPHGGCKESGYGKDLSGYALEDHTRIKHVMEAD